MSQSDGKELAAGMLEQLQEVSARASAPPPDPPPKVVPGRVLDGRYRVDGSVGVGGVGTVYFGTQLALGRKVAIKLLHEGLDASFRARFEREAKALAGLRHPNVVSVTDYGVDEGTPYLVMELLEGETLFQRLERGRLLPEHALELSRQLLRALSYVHEQGLVHRDVKPANLFLELTVEGEERLKLLDFGLAKFVGGASTEGETVTRAGNVVGTPAYMAPEQIAGDAVDARTDVYSAAVLLYQLLTGRVPFLGAPMEQLKSHLIAEVPPLRSSLPDLTPRPELEQLVARAMRKKRDERFESAVEMLAALEAVPQPWLLDAAQLAEEARRAARSRSLLARAQAMLAARPWLAYAAAALIGFIAIVRGSCSDGEVESAPPAPKLSARGESEPAHAPKHAEAPPKPAAASTTPSEVAPLVKDPSAARNPWTKDTPTALRLIRKAANAGDKGDEKTITLLRKYNQSTDKDARGHLLLARLYLNRDWREAALNQFLLVHEVDPTARGAPGMLSALIELAQDDDFGAGAAKLVRTAYGMEALSTIDAALATPRDPAAEGRLRALRIAIMRDAS